MYFADNQTKQKAFDRTYNARARSDYAQGRKLQALIKQENSNDALTEQLASLYANTLRKAADYEYDRLSNIFTKRAPKVIVPETTTKKATHQNIRKFMTVPRTYEAELEKKIEIPTKTRTYVPEEAALEEKIEIPAKGEIEAKAPAEKTEKTKKAPTKAKSVKSPPNTTALAAIDSFEVSIIPTDGGKNLPSYNFTDEKTGEPLAQKELRDFVWDQLEELLKNRMTKKQFEDALPFTDDPEVDDKEEYLTFKNSVRELVNKNLKTQPTTKTKKTRASKPAASAAAPIEG